MKKIISGFMAILTILGELLFCNILPMPSVSAHSICTAEDPIYFTAHRGINAKAPENSLPAYQMAIDMGYYSVETDVRLTKDNVWVISHNDNIGKWYNGDVNISECTYDELMQYHVKSGHGAAKYKDLKIPTLEEYLDLFVGTNVRPQIEIKSDSNDGIEDILNAVEKRGLSEQALVISFDLEQLRFIREKAPKMELWYLCGKITDRVIEEAKTIGGNVWLSCDFSENDVTTLQKSVDAGFPVSMWTVDKIRDARELYAAGFRYMETDRLCP